ncbi:DUF1376 domain-containing protein [Citrobacter koseri]|uniref:DUF1376 domain-containing protein n=1 Tax=Citrobacter koseri TaxID=545 RepID=UPI001862BD80|nr:DUF1376 domain-containing protein [Citrobacter koseri]WEE19118.1 DUF1376 domain-containing protein [Citrobacter koseri]BCL48906.1 hypothetical protein MPUCK001_27240 [Citrobacter koseri]
MAALPYMQLYIADYLADTMHLSTEEHGAYLLLMFNYWQTGRGIPKSRLAKIARLTNERWSAVENSLKEFFTESGDEWIHDRIERDLEAVRSSLKQKSAAGKASAIARKAKKGTEKQRGGNERSTVVKSPSQREGNGKSTNKDPDTDLKENPSLNAGANEIAGGHTQPEEPTPPRYLDGVFEPIGKFSMSGSWLPSVDFRQRAAQWGILLPEPDYLDTELAEFSAYWESEKKVFTQIQWEQKFARHVALVRAKKKPETGGNDHAGLRTGPAPSRAVQQIREARAEWERKNRLAGDRDGVAAMGSHGGDIFEPLDAEERNGAFGYLDCPDRLDD